MVDKFIPLEKKSIISNQEVTKDYEYFSVEFMNDLGELYTEVMEILSKEILTLTTENKYKEIVTDILDCQGAYLISKGYSSSDNLFFISWLEYLKKEKLFVDKIKAIEGDSILEEKEKEALTLLMEKIKKEDEEKSEEFREQDNEYDDIEEETTSKPMDEIVTEGINQVTESIKGYYKVSKDTASTIGKGIVESELGLKGKEKTKEVIDKVKEKELDVKAKRKLSKGLSKVSDKLSDLIHRLDNK